MAITPIEYRIAENSNFTSDKNDKNSHKKHYNDPLTKWPVRGLAYTNEIGAAISEVAPTLGLLLWAPAIFYFGADIYDKYKNDKNSFDPNAMRGTSQAVFQLLASVILPTTAVLIGQKAASFGGLFRKNGLTIQTQENITKFSISYMQRRKLGKYQDNVQRYKDKHFAALSNSIHERYRESSFRQGFSSVINKLTDGWLDRYRSKKLDRIKIYSEKSIDRMFSVRENLFKQQKPQEFSNRLYNKFKKAIKKYEKNPEFKEYSVEYAAKEVLKKYEQSRIFKAKMFKTLGGFVALGLAIKPIDSFVEKFIIERYFESRISSFKDDIES
ncbi:hypothetical protein IJF81_04970 [bacterium]|nr:hypothetical protein [bacterium]